MGRMDELMSVVTAAQASVSCISVLAAANPGRSPLPPTPDRSWEGYTFRLAEIHNPSGKEGVSVWQVSPMR